MKYAIIGFDTKYAKRVDNSGVHEISTFENVPKATAFVGKATPSGRKATAFVGKATPSGRKATAFVGEATPSGRIATPFETKATPSGRIATPFETKATSSGRIAFAIETKAPYFVIESNPFIAIEGANLLKEYAILSEGSSLVSNRNYLVSQTGAIIIRAIAFLGKASADKGI
jgi:hypothetical protein